jgi:tetrapyrrole methylase family protein/MazG family protein
MTESDRALAVEVAALRKTLRRLRAPKGCPWDRAQALDDMVSYLIEEAYELLRAEQKGALNDVEEELGDVFFIIVFIHELLLERRGAPLSRIVASAHRKIIARHPHVFGGTKARNTRESVAEWERIKGLEKPARRRASLLDAVPEKLPPLRRAAALQAKAAEVGFDWPDHTGIIDKLREETAELAREIERGGRERIKDEIGDTLFTVVNLARRLRVDPESALERTSAKFSKRFAAIEASARRRRKPLASMSLEEMERVWQRSKRPKRSGRTQRRAPSPRSGATRRRA